MPGSCGIILLAAGSSGRLGRSKQLLPFQGKTLLQHLIDEAKASPTAPIIVVLGANADLIQQQLVTDEIEIAINGDWEKGMASSIGYGINALLKVNPLIDAAILMTCDQPFVSTQVLNELINTHRKTGNPIITCGYDETTGPPALFHQSIFPELLQLTGDKGARKIVEEHPDKVSTIPFPEGNIDIDTAADYERLSG